MQEQSIVQKWGNSQGLQISKKILHDAGLQVNDPVSIEVIGGSIVLKKSFVHKTFEERLSDYDGNISTYHMDWGEDVGKEVIE